MNLKTLLTLLMATIFLSYTTTFDYTSSLASEKFNFEKDILLAHFDCKTDVDDLHSVAAFVSLMSNDDFSKIKYHAVAGTYGVQEGLYVPPNALFELAFDDNWTDAHSNFEKAVNQVKKIALKTLSDHGNIWIADAGQSDFSAALVKAIQIDAPQVDISKRIHLVQHSNWNEKVTSASSLKFVKEEVNYHKIPDGNTVGNGTPGFRTPDFTDWKAEISNDRLKEIWELAVDLGNQYNGKDGRYLNEAIAAGGLDFSDLSETCWILGLEEIEDTAAFFKLYLN
jgi:hypothetical protein